MVRLVVRDRESIQEAYAASANWLNEAASRKKCGVASTTKSQ